MKASKSEKEKKEIEREKRKGYAEMKVYEYRYKRGEFDPESKNLVQHEIYDKKGNMVTHCDNDGYKFVNKYNDKGDKIETQIFIDEELQAIVKNKGDNTEETIYDVKNNIDYKLVYETEKRKDYTEVKVYEYTYKFGKLDPESKKLQDQYAIDNEENIVSNENFKYVNIYNDKGLIIEKQCFENEKLDYITKYKYNNKGLLIEEIGYGTQGEPYSKRIYEWE